MRCSHGIKQHAPLRLQYWKDRRAALLNRTDFIGGDFFNAPTLPKADPAGRDVYMLRAILHDWPDAKASQILVNLRQAMGERAALCRSTMG